MPAAAFKPKVTSFAPQFLIDDLARSIAFYRKLGFEFDPPWDGFYAIGRLDGLELHLREAPKNPAERTHRRDKGHLDASAGVDGVEMFYQQCRSNHVAILKPLAPDRLGHPRFLRRGPGRPYHLLRRPGGITGRCRGPARVALPATARHLLCCSTTPHFRQPCDDSGRQPCRQSSAFYPVPARCRHSSTPAACLRLSPTLPTPGAAPVPRAPRRRCGGREWHPKTPRPSACSWAVWPLWRASKAYGTTTVQPSAGDREQLNPSPPRTGPRRPACRYSGYRVSPVLPRQQSSDDRSSTTTDGGL